MRPVGGQRRDKVGSTEPVRGRWSWRRRSLAMVLASAAAFLGLLPAAAPSWAGLLGAPTSKYIVSDLNGVSSLLASADVLGVGAQVDEPLDAADGVLADLTPLQANLLSLLPGVFVTPDVNVSVQDSSNTPPHKPSAVFSQESGATSVWQSGDTGQGVNVAVLDTGIAALPDFAGRLAGGVDLSGEGNPFHDGYGHGTFVAGLVAGNGASSGGQYTGEAPGAGLVAVKVAGSSGVTDLATVISGVGWTIVNQAALNIRVLNMSLGYQPIESTAIDPLDIAVEKAWQAGIVVVASAGNAGPFNGTILSPGDDPLVITTGALDDNGTPALADDTMPAFSSVGPTSPDGWFKPDLVASGRSVVSVRAPGSTIDTQYPSARIGTGNFVGSGTSFSAAITSGAVALLLALNPAYSPNTVKAELLGTTTAGPANNPFVDGHGALNIANAAAEGQLTLAQQPSVAPLAGISVTGMSATVSLSSTWADSSWNPQQWSGTAWNGTAWNGTAWNGTAWNGTAWNGTAWNGTAWNGTAWNGTAWNGTAWNGTAWNGTAWNGTAWNGTAWNGTAWNGTAWNGTAWNGSSWT